MRKKCSSDREKLFKFLRSLEQFIQTVKGQINFCQQNAFVTCSWRFLRSNKLEQFKFKLEKCLVFRNKQEKLEDFIVKLKPFCVVTYGLNSLIGHNLGELVP